MIEAADHDHYFVDEAGDATLFNKRGAVIIGREGVSRFFMVGVAHVPKPTEATQKIELLRTSLLADPYFAGVPSMQPGQRKTALCFHAKDDIPEVRRDVFRLLSELNCTVQVAIRRKSVLATQAAGLRKIGRKVTADMIYDDLVPMAFRNLLHRGRHKLIGFARRGKSDRLHALGQAIHTASHVEPASQTGEAEADQSITTIYAAQPDEAAGLQIIDYYLWALQRLFERQERRFFDLVAGDFRLIMDLDDTRHQPYGEWYSAANLLDPQRIKPETS